MAVKKPATQAAPATDMASLLALVQQLQAQVAAKPATIPAPTSSVAPKAAVVDHAGKVTGKLIEAGAKITRVGKSGTTPKGFSKAWVDVTIGGVRIQGNAFLTK